MSAPRLRVLALTHRVPFPPDKGDKIRTFHLLRRVARSAEVHLVCFADPPADSQHREHLETLFASVTIVPLNLRLQKLAALPWLASTVPLTLRVFHRTAMTEAVARVVARVRPDAIYAESSSMAPYALAHPDVPLVMDYVDIDSVKWRSYAERGSLPSRFVHWREAATLERFERTLATQAACSVVTAPRELEALRSIAPGCAARVLANGVDTEYFTPRTIEPSSPSLVFAGAMDYQANADGAEYLARTVLPRVRSAVPDVTLTIVGANPTPAVRALGSLPGVTVTGTVPDIRTYVQGALLSVCPLRVARGVQNKVLEAMAMGVPVVSSTAAADGVDATPGSELVVARASEDGAELARAVVDLLGDAPRRALLAKAARARVEVRYGWDPRATELLDLLASVARASRPSPPAPAPVSASGTRAVTSG